MSRVAKAAIKLPNNVEFSIDNYQVCIKGPKGHLMQIINKKVLIAKSDENVLNFSAATNDASSWAQAGTARALVNNMVQGVTNGFERILELVGVGYRAQVAGRKITLSLGYSHPIEYNLPEGVTAETPSVTTIILKAMDKQLLGQVSSEIRAYRPPEPYKGKGIKYAGEIIIRKETKKK